MSVAPSVQSIGQYPWQPQSTIRGNLAIGQLRETLTNALRHHLNGLRRRAIEAGQPIGLQADAIHAPTVLCLVGALCGFAAQRAALSRAASGEPIPPSGLLAFTTAAGERFLVGDWPNRYIFNDPGSQFPLFGLAAAAVIDGGYKPADLPDVGEMARAVASRIGAPGPLQVRSSPAHAPIWTPPQLLSLFWRLTHEVMEAPLPKMGDAAPPPGIEPPLEPSHWPMVISIVAQQFMRQTAKVVPPPIAFSLVMEAAIIAAKLDPEPYSPGVWRIEASEASGPLKPVIVARLAR